MISAFDHAFIECDRSISFPFFNFTHIQYSIFCSIDTDFYQPFIKCFSRISSKQNYTRDLVSVVRDIVCCHCASHGMPADKPGIIRMLSYDKFRFVHIEKSQVEWHLDQTCVHSFFGKQMQHRRICLRFYFGTRVEDQCRFIRWSVKKLTVISLNNDNSFV